MRGDGADFIAELNPDSCEVLRDACLEPALSKAMPSQRFQFERVGYSCVDRESTPGSPVYNRTIGIRDSWAQKLAQ